LRSNHLLLFVETIQERSLSRQVIVQLLTFKGLVNVCCGSIQNRVHIGAYRPQFLSYFWKYLQVPRWASFLCSN
jgi:hypothetical protein